MEIFFIFIGFTLNISVNKRRQNGLIYVHVVKFKTGLGSTSKILVFYQKRY